MHIQLSSQGMPGMMRPPHQMMMPMMYPHMSMMPGAAAAPSSEKVKDKKENRKGTNTVSTNGVTANFMFFKRGTFWVLPLTYFYLPKGARAYLLFPNLSEAITFAATP